MKRALNRKIKSYLMHQVMKKYLSAVDPHSLKVLKDIKNCHKGQRCFIMGNGPSLNKCDLTKLKNEKTFGTNAIYLNYDNMGFHPTYYTVEDLFVAEDRAEEIKSYQGPQIKFLGNHTKPFLDGAIDATWINLIFDFTEVPGFPFFSTDVSKKVHVCGTVTYSCLQLAYYMGFSEVYMIGFDHYYVIPAEDVVNETDIISSQDDVNHFHKDYFGKGYRWHDPKVDRMERGYRKAKDVFEKDGRKIYNATVGGHLDVFERVTYDDLF